MSCDDMAAKFVTQAQRPLEIDPRSRAPPCNGGSGRRLSRSAHGKPAVARRALAGYGETNSGTGDRGANVNRFGIVMGCDHNMGVATPGDLAYFANVGDETCEHACLLEQTMSLWNDVPASVPHRHLPNSKVSRRSGPRGIRSMRRRRGAKMRSVCHAGPIAAAPSAPSRIGA